MTGFLRFIGIVNASAWFGAVLFGIIALPVFFTDHAKSLFPPPYNGAAAEMVIHRLYILQHWCGAIALVHLLAEWLYMGRVLERLTLAVLTTIFCVNLMFGFVVQPRMHEWHLTTYRASAPMAERQHAYKLFRAWHGISQATNLAVAAGLLFYVWRVSGARQATRFQAYQKPSIGWK